MTRVALIVTGDTEFAAMCDSLKRAFPALDFEVHASPRGQAMDGFTSNPLRDEEPLLSKLSPDGLELLTPLAKLVDQLLLSVNPGRNGDPYDYAVLIDDLEIANRSKPELVVEHVRRAVPRRIDAVWPSSEASRQKAREIARSRCSFHLLSPMVESYFFGESAALDRAGRVSGRPSLFDPSAADMEAFLVHDPDYESVTPGGTKREAKGDWRRSQDQRPHHPKKYVQYLADPDRDGRTLYQEATTGRDALKRLDWDQVLRDVRFARTIRSLFADLAQMAQPAPTRFDVTDGRCSPTTWRYGDRSCVLRNV